MTRTAVEALAVAAMVGVSALSLSAPGKAGRGWGPGWGHWHGGGCGWGPGYWGAGLIGLGVGAAVGAALTAPAYAGPPPYGPVEGAYGPPAWTQIRIPAISLTMMDSLISANRA
jgi:hypothetical protein